MQEMADSSQSQPARLVFPKTKEGKKCTQRKRLGSMGSVCVCECAHVCTHPSSPHTGEKEEVPIAQAAETYRILL